VIRYSLVDLSQNKSLSLFNSNVKAVEAVVEAVETMVGAAVEQYLTPEPGAAVQLLPIPGAAAVEEAGAAQYQPLLLHPVAAAPAVPNGSPLALPCHGH
jgi:hypothetical protein